MEFDERIFENGSESCDYVLGTKRGQWCKHHAYKDDPDNDISILSFYKGFASRLKRLIKTRERLIQNKQPASNHVNIIPESLCAVYVIEDCTPLPITN